AGRPDVKGSASMIDAAMDGPRDCAALLTACSCAVPGSSCQGLERSRACASTSNVAQLLCSVATALGVTLTPHPPRKSQNATESIRVKKFTLKFFDFRRHTLMHRQQRARRHDDRPADERDP